MWTFWSLTNTEKKVNETIQQTGLFRQKFTLFLILVYTTNESGLYSRQVSAAGGSAAGSARFRIGV
jgi:hypothetical protein